MTGVEEPANGQVMLVGQDLGHRPDDPHHRGAENGTAIVPRAAEDQHDPDEEGGDHRIDAFRRDRAVEVGEQRAAQAHQAGTEDKGLQAAEGDVLAQRGGRRLVVPDGAHHAAPGRAELVLDQQVGDDEAEQHEAEVGELREEVVEVAERARQVVEAARRVGQPVFRLRDQADDLRHADGGDGEVVGAEAQGDLADRPGDEAGHRHRAQPAGRDRQLEAAEAPLRRRPGENGRGVGPDREEAGDAGVEQAGQAPLDVEAEGEDGDEDDVVYAEHDFHDGKRDKACPNLRIREPVDHGGAVVDECSRIDRSFDARHPQVYRTCRSCRRAAWSI